MFSGGLQSSAGIFRTRIRSFCRRIHRWACRLVLRFNSGRRDVPHRPNSGLYYDSIRDLISILCAKSPHRTPPPRIRLPTPDICSAIRDNLSHIRAKVCRATQTNGTKQQKDFLDLLVLKNTFQLYHSYQKTQKNQN